MHNSWLRFGGMVTLEPYASVLECCIVGCYGLVIFTIKASLHLNFGATLFGFEQYTTKIYTELDIFDFMSLFLCICVFSSFYFRFYIGFIAQ